MGGSADKTRNSVIESNFQSEKPLKVQENIKRREKIIPSTYLSKYIDIKLRNFKDHLFLI